MDVLSVVKPAFVCASVLGPVGSAIPAHSSVERDATPDPTRFVFMDEAYGPRTVDLQRQGEAPPKEPPAP
jgi:hypothetical protein